MTREQAQQTLEDCRRKIDKLDLRLLALLNERTRVVAEIAAAKHALGLPVYEPRREDEVYANITAHNWGPLGSGALRRIFERIIDEMRSIQKQRITEESDQGRPAPGPES